MSSSSAQPDDAATESPPRRPRVLMLTHRLPYPPDRGDRIRSYHMIRFLARHVDLALGCTSDEPIWMQHHHLLATMARRVALYPISRTSIRMRAARAWLAGAAITPACFYRSGLGDQLARWHEEEPFDAVLTFCTAMCHYVRRLRRHVPAPFTGRHVLDLVDVDSAKWASYAQNSLPPKRWLYACEARRLRRLESGQDEPFDAVSVVSEAEAKAYRSQVADHGQLVAVGNGVDMDYFQPLEDTDARTLCFVGVLNYRPNVEGIAWFVRHVMPMLVEREPRTRLLIVGRHPTARVEELGQCPGVEVVGSVPDVRDYIRDASVVIAPLLLARGVQNKVLEAMACQRVAICSPAAAEGIEATVGEHLLVADQPRDWVEAITRVFDDPRQRRAIAAAARDCVEQRYTWDARLHPMLDLLVPGLGASRPTASDPLAATA